MKKLLTAIALFLTLTLTSCAALQPENGATARLAIQYTTLKVIEDSNDITADGVIEQVDKVRALVEADRNISFDNLFRQVRSQIDFAGMQPSDQLLVAALFEQLEAQLPELPSGEQNRLVRIMTLLDWIESAAKLS